MRYHRFEHVDIQFGHDDGENDLLNEVEDKGLDNECGGDDTDSWDGDSEEDSIVGKNVLVDESDADSEGDEVDLGNELGLDGSDGPSGEVILEEEGVGPQERPYFYIGMSFAKKANLVAAINTYTINYGVNVKLKKSDPYRVRAKCQNGCPFVLFALKDGSNPGLIVKTFNNKHRCNRVFKNYKATVRWLASHFRKNVQKRPSYKVADIKKDMADEFKLSVNKWKCKRAKQMIIKQIKESYIDEFKNLEAYYNELRNSNCGSNVYVEVSKDDLE